jgi:hypothetical protein
LFKEIFSGGIGSVQCMGNSLKEQIISIQKAHAKKPEVRSGFFALVRCSAPDKCGA